MGPFRPTGRLLFAPTRKRLWWDLWNTHKNMASKFTWTPEIRLLDKDERLPEIDPGQKMMEGLQQGWRSMKGITMSPEKHWPPMDPLRPTAEQKRIANTGNVMYMSSSKFIPPYKIGFRIVPPELVDWRATFYGDQLEEMPYFNEKAYFSQPDYYNSGMVFTGNEQKGITDSQARNVEDQNTGCYISPKIDAWCKYDLNKQFRNLRWSGQRHYWCVLGYGGLCYLGCKYTWRTVETKQRKHKEWWDSM